jgi:hypothetical protein
MLRSAAASIDVLLVAINGAQAGVPANPAPIETHLLCTTITNRDSGQPNALGPSSFEIFVGAYSMGSPWRTSDAHWRIADVGRADPQGFAARAADECKADCYARHNREFGGDWITLVISSELRHLDHWAPVPADLLKADIKISSGDVVYWGQNPFAFENTAATLRETGTCRPIIQRSPSAPDQKAN